MHNTFLFDMDGTLVDTFDLIHESFNAALAENKKGPITKEDFDKKLFGKPVDSTVMRLLRISDDREYGKVVRDFRTHWLRNLQKVEVFKNVPLTLERLRKRGHKLGVVSTSPRGVISETLRQTGIYDYFDVLIGEEDAKRKKPHQEPVVNALKLLGAKPEETVFVGDTIYDVQAGKRAGCHTVFLLNPYNAGVLEESEPDRVIKNVSELLENGGT